MGAIECSPHGRGTYRGPVADSWSTSYESGFCDYVARESGHCYGRPDSSFDIATTPVHSGRRAAAFTVDTDAPDGEHTRCFREGEFPDDAIYGAWFYLPAAANVDRQNWNLMHVQSEARSETDAHHLWDVSLENAGDGAVALYVRDFLQEGAPTKGPEPRVPVPIGEWFQVEVRWKRSKVEEGVMALYQDGQLLWSESDRITDDSDWAQWYVGNLATSLPPEASTIYVDDVTIRPSP